MILIRRDGAVFNLIHRDLLAWELKAIAICLNPIYAQWLEKGMVNAS
jgi:hypothetical protein